MAYQKQLERLSEIDQKESENISKILFKTFHFSFEEKNKATGKDNKRELLELWILLFTKYLGTRSDHSKEAKLSIIKLIHKLKTQLELLELKQGITNLEDIKSAAKTLGRKSQSAFKTKEI